MTKTNVMRLLEAAGIASRTAEYEYDESNLSGLHAAEQVGMKERLGQTGYIRGGCSPVGMKKKYPTYIDETCILFDEIAVSAGIRGEQIILAPQDLIRYTEATEADVTKNME